MNLNPSFNWCDAGCGFGAKIEIWDTGLTVLKGQRYVCHNCGVGGYVTDEDGPKFYTDEDFEDKIR